MAKKKAKAPAKRGPETGIEGPTDPQARTALRLDEEVAEEVETED